MANKVALVALFLTTAIGGHAQLLPQIVVTDSENVEHDLYSSYLDQGMSLLIGIFFSSCTPCQTIAEELEQLYQDWGAGEHDVQFIQLSSESWETNATVEAFRTAFGVTSPVVSAEGGSVEAVQALIDAEFGDFNGAPLYLVVSPDGSVQWDVFGFGEEATITALDEALQSTGANKPTTSILSVRQNPLLSVSPNPSQYRIQAHWTAPLQDANVRVLSVHGAIIHKQSTADQSIEIPLIDWPAGIYILQVLERNTVAKSIRFIKF